MVQLTKDSGDITKQYSYDALGVEQNKGVSDAKPFRAIIREDKLTMKRKGYLLVLSYLMLLIVCCTVETNVMAEINSRTMLYVNDTEVKGDSVLTNDYGILIPLRTVLEALGSKVEWEESTNNIYFDYSDVNYVCRFVSLNPNFPDKKNILICNTENINSTNNADYIQLNPMSADGAYCMINDKTYLYQETAERLFEELGLTMDINIDMNIVKIFEE